jgi:hypothetical protein
MELLNMTTIEEMKILEYYPYRSARIIGDRMTFPRKPMQSFEEALANLAGVPVCNHVCYRVALGNDQNQKIFQFTDFWMFIGDEIEKKNW